MLVALVSLDQFWLDKESNFVRCSELVRIAVSKGCSLVVFPEMTLTGYSLDTKAVAESTEQSPTLRQFRQLALDTGVHIIFGVCLLDPVSGKPQNTLCLASPKCGVEILYIKTHPFSFAGEDRMFQGGSALGFASVADLRIGCSICYDLRFPELFSAMAANCNAVVNIANWPVRRVAHWRALLVARAIENQLFVLGVNRIGTDGNGLQYEESSMAISPDGTILVPEFRDTEIAIYDIDLMKTKQYREMFPTVRDKRYEFYQNLYEGMKVVK